MIWDRVLGSGVGSGGEGEWLKSGGAVSSGFRSRPTYCLASKFAGSDAFLEIDFSRDRFLFLA